MGNRISIDNGFPGDGTLKFYVSPPALGVALERDLQDAGVETDRLLEHSDMAREVMVFAVAFTGAGGIRQLAHLLEVFFHRNDGKEITLKADGETSTRGLTIDDFEKVLKARVEQQHTVDEHWRKLSSAGPAESDTADPDDSAAGAPTDPTDPS